MKSLKTWASVLALAWAGTGWAASPLPDQLNAYGVVQSDGKTLSLVGNTMVYGLASPLFTDYALKLRTITLPEGAKVGFKSDTVLDFPIGTIISKTFYYAKDPKVAGGWVKSPAQLAGESIDLEAYRLVETRILRRDTDGTWQANTYIWNEAQTSAALRRIGFTVNATLRDPAHGESTAFQYNVPNARQCQTCHAVDATVGQAGIEPIGPKGRLLNLDYRYSAGKLNQLVRLGQIGTWERLPADLTTLPRNVAYFDSQTGSLEARARAYADINCAHCHNKLGDARQSGLFLTLDATGSQLGICKQHAAAGSGGGNLTFDVVPGKPDKSLLVTRTEAITGQAMMPRVGRSLVDKEGVQLLRQWVADMGGNCEVK